MVVGTEAQQILGIVLDTVKQRMQALARGDVDLRDLEAWVLLVVICTVHV